MQRRDVDKSRDDLAEFAKLVGWRLAKWQAASLRLEARTSYIVGPRQSGKSRSAALVAAWRAFRGGDHHVLIVSASELGAKRLLSTVAELAVNSPMLSASVVDEQASLIRLTNSSSIRSVPASVKAAVCGATCSTHRATSSGPGSRARTWDRRGASTSSRTAPTCSSGSWASGSPTPAARRAQPSQLVTSASR